MTSGAHVHDSLLEALEELKSRVAALETTGNVAFPLICINAGGVKFDGWDGDQGGKVVDKSTLQWSGDTKEFPAAVWKSERYGPYSYRIHGLVPKTVFVVRVATGEGWAGNTQPGHRVWSVSANDEQITNIDLIRDYGFGIRAVLILAGTVNEAGEIVVRFEGSSSRDPNPCWNGLIVEGVGTPDWQGIS